MTFELDENELKEFEEWKGQLPHLEPDVFEEEYMFEYIFYPTGLEQLRR